jgi:hypothetical protein
VVVFPSFGACSCPAFVSYGDLLCLFTQILPPSFSAVT